MILNAGNLNIGSKPILRAIATALSFLLTIFLFFPFFKRNVSNSSLATLLSKSPDLESSPYKYQSPKDLILPQTPANSIAPESLIGKVTILFHRKDPTFVRAIQTHEAHNRRYGYPLLLLRHPILEGIWNKPAYILAVLLEELRKPEGQRLRWLLCVLNPNSQAPSITDVGSWVDADTVVMNPKIPLDVFLPPEQFSHFHLLVTADPRGLNNGVFFIKVHPWSIELLSAIISYTLFRPETELEYRDQSALAEILKEKQFKNNYLLLPQRWFNAYQAELHDDETRSFHLRRGDLLVHFPGVPKRDERMKHFLDRAERHMPEWEVDIISTSYPTEIKEFWDEQYELLQKLKAEARRTAEKAEDMLRSTANHLAFHRGKLSDEDIEKIESSMKDLRKTLDEKGEDKEALATALEKMTAVCNLLQVREHRTDNPGRQLLPSAVWLSSPRKPC